MQTLANNTYLQGNPRNCKNFITYRKSEGIFKQSYLVKFIKQDK